MTIIRVISPIPLEEEERMLNVSFCSEKIKY